MPEIHITQSFILNRGSSSQFYAAPGVYEFTDEDMKAHGDYILANSADPPNTPASPGSWQFAQMTREPWLKAMEQREEGLRRVAELQQKRDEQRYQFAAQQQQVYAEAQGWNFKAKADPKAMAEAVKNVAPASPMQSPYPDHPAIHDAFIGNQTASEAATGGPLTGPGAARIADNRDPKSADAMRTSDEPKPQPPSAAQQRQVGADRGQDKRSQNEG